MEHNNDDNGDDLLTAAETAARIMWKVHGPIPGMEMDDFAQELIVRFLGNRDAYEDQGYLRQYLCKLAQWRHKDFMLAHRRREQRDRSWQYDEQGAETRPGLSYASAVTEITDALPEELRHDAMRMMVDDHRCVGWRRRERIRAILRRHIVDE